MMTTHIVDYCVRRWPHLQRRDVRRLIRKVYREERRSPFLRGEEELLFDVWLRVTQIYESC